ncbi:SagB family peptide dehydrogenase [Oceanithermus sp.]
MCKICCALADDYARYLKMLLNVAPLEDWGYHDVQEKIVLPDMYLNFHTKFLDVLFGRVSERRFGNNPIPLHLLATIIAYAFRPTGHCPSDFYNAYHKTSPSGGGLHPTEAFILVRSVEDLRAGLYHYYARRHELHLIRELDQDYARDKLVSYTAGQPYTMHAGAGIILTQRFDRHYWKYYRNDRAALVLSMDVGALAQTLYLTSTYVGLPGFFTGAINAGDIEDDLGLHGPEHGATALFLLGTPHTNPSSEATPVIEKPSWWRRERSHESS